MFCSNSTDGDKDFDFFDFFCAGRPVQVSAELFERPTLEARRRDAVSFLAVESRQKIQATILSRCREGRGFGRLAKIFGCPEDHLAKILALVASLLLLARFLNSCGTE